MNEKTLIVSDTGPIITFCQINRLDILGVLYGNIVIPKAVFDELNIAKYENEVIMVQKCPFITVEEVKNKKEVDIILNSSTKLHRGETEAIVLTEELGKDIGQKFLIIDDSTARAYADMRGIKTIGAIRVLSDGLRERLILPTEIEYYINIMKKNHRFYSEFLYDELRRCAENISSQPITKKSDKQKLISNLVKDFICNMGEKGNKLIK